MSDIDPKKHWDEALNSAYLFADIVMESDDGLGLPRLADMSPDEITKLTAELMRDGQQEPEVMRHTLQSLLVLLKDAELRSSRDALTKIYNRRHFEEMVELHIERMARGEAEDGALVMIDLDGFKPINDRYGHDAGDAALKKVADTLRASVRLSDVAARVGGDEFAILLMDANEKQALDMAQRLRSVFSALTFAWEGKLVPIRASIGVTTIAQGENADTIYRNADAAMYAEKQGKKTPARQAAADYTPVR